jgi:prophage regulatory protein
MSDEALSRLLPRREVLRLIGISNTTLWHWIKSGQFPEPLILNPTAKFHKLAWKEDDIRQWIASRQKGQGTGLAGEVYAEATARAERRFASARKHGWPGSAIPPPVAQEASASGRPKLLTKQERQRLEMSQVIDRTYGTADG